MTEATAAYSWRQIPHLAQRTLWSLRKPVPDADGERWLVTLLSPAESVLYRQMASVDRAHAINCARSVESFGDEVVVASALHDIGKTQAGLGTPGRVAASFAGSSDMRWDRGPRARDRGFHDLRCLTSRISESPCAVRSYAHC